MLRLDFAAGNFKEAGYLQVNLMAQLDALEERFDIASNYGTATERLNYLIRTVSDRLGRTAVLLVDEYDKPIVDALEVPDVARANRDDLRGLYSVVKARETDIRFCARWVRILPAKPRIGCVYTN